MKIYNPPVFSQTMHQDSDIEQGEFEWIGKTVTAPFWVHKGIHMMHIRGNSDPNYGGVNWFIDGIPVVMEEGWWSDVPFRRLVKSYRVAIETSGKHVLTGLCSGTVDINRIWFKPL